MTFMAALFAALIFCLLGVALILGVMAIYILGALALVGALTLAVHILIGVPYWLLAGPSRLWQTITHRGEPVVLRFVNSHDQSVRVVCANRKEARLVRKSCRHDVRRRRQYIVTDQTR